MRTPRAPSVFRRFTPAQFRNPFRDFQWPPRFSGGIMLALAGLAVLMSGPARTVGVSAFVDPMLRGLDESRSLFSTTYSIGTLVSALTLLVMTLAAIVFAGALFFMSGVGGVLTLAARTLVPHWFARRRGRAFSIIGLAATASLAVVPVFNESLIRRLGWRDAWRVNSIIILLVLAPLLWFFVRDRLEHVGQHPDGIPPETSSFHLSAVEHGHTLKQAVCAPAFWALIAAGLVPSLVLTGLSFNQVAILTDRGLPGTLAAATFTVESLVGLPTTLLAGSLADRFSLRYTLAAGQVFLALAMVMLPLTDRTALALAWRIRRVLDRGSGRGLAFLLRETPSGEYSWVRLLDGDRRRGPGADSVWPGVRPPGWLQPGHRGLAYPSRPRRAGGPAGAGASAVTGR